MKDRWDDLADEFDLKGEVEPVNPAVADNVFIAWPVILEQIKKNFLNQKGISILDYGCGTGTFCNKLYSLGFKNVTGFDNSSEMIRRALKNYKDTDIHFTDKEIDSKSSFDLIVGIMVFQFIDDINKILKKLIRNLNTNGLLIFAVHNPDYVKEHIKIDSGKFTDMIANGSSSIGTFSFNTLRIPIFIRDEKTYDKILEKINLKKVFSANPSFTKEFLKQFPIKVSRVSEYLILVYKK